MRDQAKITQEEIKKLISKEKLVEVWMKDEINDICRLVGVDEHR